MSWLSSVFKGIPGLEAINAGIGLLGSINQNNSARAGDRYGMSLQSQALKQLQADDARRLQAYNDALSAGAFDPSSQIANLRKSYDVAQGITTRNIGGAARSAGYRPGDSPLLRSLRNATQSGKLAMAQAENQVANNAVQRQQQALSYTAPRAPGAMLGLGNYERANSAGQYSDPSALIQSIMSAGGIRKKSANLNVPTYSRYLSDMSQPWTEVSTRSDW